MYKFVKNESGRAILAKPEVFLFSITISKSNPALERVMLFDLNQKMYPFMCRIHSHQLWWVHRYHLVVVHAVF